MSSEGQSELNLHSMNIAFHSVSVSITTLSDISWVESVPTARGNLTLRGGLYAVDGDLSFILFLVQRVYIQVKVGV